MKKFFIVMTLIGLLSFAGASNIDDAVNWMYNNGITNYDNSVDFKASKPIRRDEAAKFFVEFSKLIGKTDYVKSDSECKFGDINQSWSNLKDYVVKSCKLGLIAGVQTISYGVSVGNGGQLQTKKNDVKRFTPKNNLTNAMAVAILIRLIDGNKIETGLNHRSDNYYLKANELNILQGVNMKDKKANATRGNVAKIIYNASKLYNIDQLTGETISKTNTTKQEIKTYKDITKAGSYILKNDLNLGKNILSIKANDVTLDCGGFKIFNDGSDLVYLYGNNITIKNCILEHTNGGWSCIRNRGSGKNIKIQDNKLLTCGISAILFNALSNGLIDGNEIIGDGRAGRIGGSPVSTCITLRNIFNSTIQNNVSSQCGLGLELEKSSGNKFLKNKFSNVMGGIDAWGINNNNFEYNTISTKGNRNAFYIDKIANTVNKSTCKNNKLIGNEIVSGPVILDDCAEIVD